MRGLCIRSIAPLSIRIAALTVSLAALVRASRCNAREVGANSSDSEERLASTKLELEQIDVIARAPAKFPTPVDVIDAEQIAAMPVMMRSICSGSPPERLR